MHMKGMKGSEKEGFPFLSIPKNKMEHCNPPTGNNKKMRNKIHMRYESKQENPARLTDY